MTRKEFDTLCNTCANNTSEGPEHANWTFWRWMQQEQREFWGMLEEVSKIETKRILEIGSAHGGGLIYYDRMVGPDGQVVSVNFSDAPNGHWEEEKNAEGQVISRRYLDGPPAEWTMDYVTCTSDMHFIPTDSHEPETLEAVKAALTGPVDFLFIDGDHSEEGARMDYEMYSPLIREGGIVGFHDISYDTLIQVNAFFKTIDKPKKRIEFTHGIGLVYL